MITGRHVALALGGFFAVVALVNGIFLVLALDTWSGLERENAYVEGLKYNQEIAAARRQEETGWRARYSVEAVAGGGARLSVHYHDRNGTPLDGLTVDAAFHRPTAARDDRALALHETGEGAYLGSVALPADGQWNLVVTAVADDGTRHRLEDRLWLN